MLVVDRVRARNVEKRLMFSRLLPALAVASALLVAGARVAHADDVEAARQHYAQGSKSFDLGLYDQAVKEYMAAYEAKPDPALLYNIAQAHKLAGHPEQAIRFYRTYLSRVPDAQNADEVRAKIAELQKAVDQQQKAQSMPPDHVKPLGSVAPTPTVAAAPSPSPSASSTPAVRDVPADDAHRARTEKIAGIAVAGVGVATLAVGIGLSVKATQDANQLSALDRQGGVFDSATDASGRTLGKVGPALIGVGAAAVVVGGVVFLIGRRAAHPPRAMEAAR